MQGPSIAEYSQKCTSPPPPHGANQNKSAANRPRTIFIQIYIARNGSAEVTQARGRPSFPAHSAGRKKPSPHVVRSGGSFMSEDAPERKVALGPDS